MRVGFIGLGSQGGPMAVAIHEAGFALQVWARRDAVRDEFRSRGVTVASSPRALAQRCDVVCICVTGDEDVHGLVREEGMLAAMAQESVLVIHSTVSPALCERLAAVGAERGVVVVDAPVSGGGDAVRKKRLLVLAGGASEAVERLRPVFAAYGDPVLHVGAVGDGQRAKIVNNFACIANLAVAELALQLGTSVGLARPELRTAILNGSGRSFALDALEPLIQPTSARHVAALFDKDMRLADSLAVEGRTEISHVHALVERLLEGLRAIGR
jgi:3-hydroxyisobutyrate dehydrogenase